MLRANDLVGPYRLIRKLGQGQFGVVWLAERPNADPPYVALKLPLDPDIDLDALLQETTLWARASGHPNVLPIIEARIYNGQVVIASEYAPDGSVLDWLRSYNGRAPYTKAAIDVTIGILAGLTHLHQQRIIHRDLKPANILLQGSTPRLSDFGLARVFASSIHSNVVAGTQAYMAPEAFDGVRNEQTDVWSVGVILYQLLAGNLPFPQRDATSLMGAILRHPFVPLPASVMPPLREIVACALEKDPAKRFQSAAEMGAALRALSRSKQQIEYQAATVVGEETQVKGANWQGRSRTINNKPSPDVTTPKQATEVVSLDSSVARQRSRPKRAPEGYLKQDAQKSSPLIHTEKLKSSPANRRLIVSGFISLIVVIAIVVIVGLSWRINKNNAASRGANANNSNPNENRVNPAQQRTQETPASLAPTLSASIRQIDFRNFTYPLSSDDAEMFKKKMMQVRNGKYDNGKSGTDWQAFSIDKILYGDLTGDGKEEAVIPVVTEWVGANPANSISRGFYLYTISSGQPSLLMTPDALNYSRDYTPFENTDDECDGWVWNIQAKNIHQLLLTLELGIGGRHCVDRGYSVTMSYRWNGERLVLAANPAKRRSG